MFDSAITCATRLVWANSEQHWCNDVHSRLNRTPVAHVHRPTALGDLQRIVRHAALGGRRLAVTGSSHAMGGQQFLSGGDLIDMRGLHRVVAFDRVGGLIEVEAGIEWPELIGYLHAAQRDATHLWSIRQKQTGADRLSIGGALAANVHGRGLTMRPIIDDVESFTLVDAHGDLIRCARDENAELFGLVIGGYGLLGVIATVTLRLAPRVTLERVVEVIDVETLPRRFAERIANGHLYGDFQFSTDEQSDGFLRRGVFATYRPVDRATSMPEQQRELSAEDWRRLLRLGHIDKGRAYETYVQHYLTTSGQLYWSDTHQLGTYLDDYHADLDRELGTDVPGSEMISEIYVPRDALVPFLHATAADFRDHRANVVYGTIRLIERDDETFLAWAREPWACVVFNLHVDHAPVGIAGAAAHFRRLIDLGRSFDGSYYLTYHRWACRGQLLSCYPQFPAFLRLKRRHDPGEVFQSDWYRHYRRLFDALI